MQEQRGEEDFLLVDVVTDLTGSLPSSPRALSDPGTRWVVYVCRRAFDDYLCAGQLTLDDARKQFYRDLRRCRFTNSSSTDRIPDELVRYCTQSVMALPLQLLSDNGTVADLHPSTPMKVSFRGHELAARKRLWYARESREYRVAITVRASTHGRWQTIDIRMQPHDNLALRQFLKPSGSRCGPPAKATHAEEPHVC